MKKFLSFLVLTTTLLTACGERNATYDNFATCIADSGTEFFGAFWCPHCADQKELFSDSVDLLPYVECDANGKNSEYAYCKAEGVQSYPTWKFPDGTVQTGVLSLEELSEQTSCPLPDEESVLLKE